MILQMFWLGQVLSLVPLRYFTVIFLFQALEGGLALVLPHFSSLSPFFRSIPTTDSLEQASEFVFSYLS